MSYDGVVLKKIIHIDKIYSIHYFEYRNDFKFEGESHDFWELVYVDKGEARITGGQTSTILKKGEIAFHQPGEFHNVKTVGHIAPNLIVISFDCTDQAMEYFREKICILDSAERDLLANIIIEARHCFDCRLDDPYLQNMPVKETEQIGAEQLILLYLMQFLIHLMRRGTKEISDKKHIPTPPVITIKNKEDEAMLSQITSYMTAHIDTNMTIEKICRDNLISRSRLQRLIKENYDCGVIEYFSFLKTEAAKALIRTNQMNVTQVAIRLGYTSINHFSHQFKKITGMSPTEYSSSIKAMADKGIGDGGK